MSFLKKWLGESHLTPDDAHKEEVPVPAAPEITSEERAEFERELAELDQKIKDGNGVLDAHDANRRKDLERMLGQDGGQMAA